MPSYNRRKTRADAVKKYKHAHRIWASKLKKHFAKRKLPKCGKRRLQALLGLRPYSGPIRASDLAAARRLSREYVKVICAFRKVVPHNRWFHITLLADEFVVGERDPCLLIRRLKGKADKQMRALNLNAIVRIDVNPLPNHPRMGRGGSFLFHVHCLCFTDQPFDVKKARSSMASSRSWSCKLGAKPTHIVEIKPDMGDPCWWAAYDSKAAHEAKNLVVSKDDGAVKLMSTEQGYRPNLAMRLAEGLSQMALRDTMFSVGEAKDLREEVMRRVMRWHRKRWPDQRPVKAFDEEHFWRRWWRRSRVKGYRPWEVIGSTL